MTPVTRLFAITLAFTLSVLPAPRVTAQAPSTPQPLNSFAADAQRADTLTKSGERREGEHVVLFTPAGAVDDAEEASLVQRLDRGIAELWRLIGRHPWQVVKTDKITIYVAADQFVAHATGGAIFVPLVRLQDGRAPFIHEAAHELLRPFKMPPSDPALMARLKAAGGMHTWLYEGLADYFAMMVTKRTGIPDGDVFGLEGLDKVDSVCRERLNAAGGTDVLPFMGAAAAPPALINTDRIKVAPTFYACGASFTKYIVGRIGEQESIGLMPLIIDNTVSSRIEKLAGMSMDSLRSDWLASITPR